MRGGSATGSVKIAVSMKEDDNAVLSSEDSSCPDGTETYLELGLGLSVGLKVHRSSSRVRPYSSSSSSSSSLSRESIAVGTKRTADSVVASNGAGQVVGWPPIRTYRMNSLVNQAKSLATEGLSTTISKNGVVGKNDKNGFKAMAGSKAGTSAFVKVTMDGIAIGRKVDLNAHGSYEALAITLEEMFLQPPSAARSSALECWKIAETRQSRLLDGSSGFVLTYEDKDGDWMLVGDVPWQMFIGSVKRLRIMRTTDATGIGNRERSGR